MPSPATVTTGHSRESSSGTLINPPSRDELEGMEVGRGEASALRKKESGGDEVLADGAEKRGAMVVLILGREADHFLVPRPLDPPHDAPSPKLETDTWREKVESLAGALLDPLCPIGGLAVTIPDVNLATVSADEGMAEPMTPRTGPQKPQVGAGPWAIFTDPHGPRMRKQVRDSYVNSKWTQFSQLASIIPPGGDLGFDDRVFVFPTAHGYVRYESGSPVSEFREIRANARCVIESSFLQFRAILDALQVQVEGVVMLGKAIERPPPARAMHRQLIHSPAIPQIASAIFASPIYTPRSPSTDRLAHLAAELALHVLDPSVPLEQNLGNALGSTSDPTTESPLSDRVLGVWKHGDPDPKADSDSDGPTPVSGTLLATASFDPFAGDASQSPLDESGSLGTAGIRIVETAPTPIPQSIDLPSPHSASLPPCSAGAGAADVFTLPACGAVAAEDPKATLTSRLESLGLRLIYPRRACQRWEEEVYDAMIPEYLRLRNMLKRREVHQRRLWHPSSTFVPPPAPQLATMPVSALRRSGSTAAITPPRGGKGP